MPTIRMCTKVFHAVVPTVSPPPTAANQYGTRVRSPSAADPSAPYSHQFHRANSPHVAMQKPRMVSRLSAMIMPQRIPEVSTPRVAKVGVSQSQRLLSQSNFRGAVQRRSGPLVQGFSGAVQ